jgi:hypothetical protein
MTDIYNRQEVVNKLWRRVVRVTGLCNHTIKIKIIIENSSTPSGNDSGLGEGSQLFKVNGKYYLFNITWPKGGMRSVVIHRSDRITRPWEGRLAFPDLQPGSVSVNNHKGI